MRIEKGELNEALLVLLYLELHRVGSSNFVVSPL